MDTGEGNNEEKEENAKMGDENEGDEKKETSQIELQYRKTMQL